MCRAMERSSVSNPISFKAPHLACLPFATTTNPYSTDGNLPYTSILKPNATATAEIQGAFSGIDAALVQALQSIQTVQKRQTSDPSTAVILEIEQVLQVVVGDILALIPTAGDNLTACEFYPFIYRTPCASVAYLRMMRL
jgi:hypothetical protein